MCGIAGLIDKRGGGVGRETLQIMCDEVRHRGPDGDGIYLHGTLGLGHRRLAIHDLSTDGAQPMHYVERYVISFNGEIYNYIELREELVALGHAFTSKTDTEVILAAYAQWGADCVCRFNGMWAFAILDRLEDKLFCSRDRFGIKPFYLVDNEKLFAFGSEVKQLLRFLPERKVNLPLLIDYLVAGFAEHTDETFFEGVVKLPPGCNLHYDLNTHQFTLAAYYALESEPGLAELPEQDQLARCRQELSRSVVYRMRSDVKVGTCLSGGMDSSTVAAMAAAAYQTPDRFCAITAQATEKALDETEYARAVAEKAKLDWNIVRPETEDFIRVLDEVIYLQEEPVTGPSVVMQYFVMEKAKALGCKVMLDGQGGDEVLLGYERYYPAVMVHFMKHRGVIKALNQLFFSCRNNQKMTPKWILAYTIGSLCHRLRSIYCWRRARFVKSEFRKSFGFLRELAASYFDVAELQKYEIAKTNLPLLLKYEDRNSMWHSVEARLPMLDYRLVETCLGFDPAIKIKDGWTKYLLRRVAADLLPEQVVWRKSKLGFNAPNATWLGASRELMLDCILRSKILAKVTDLEKVRQMYPSMGDNMQWRLFNIAKWETLYAVRAD